MTRIKSTSIKWRIYGYMIVCIVFPFTLLSLIHSWISTKEMEEMLTRNTEQMLAQVDMMLSFYMQSIETNMSILENSPFVMDFIADEMQPDTDENLKALLSTIEREFPEVAGILIANGRGGYRSNTIVPKSRDPLYEEDWYKRALETPRESVFINKPLGRNLITNPIYGDDEIMSSVKALADPDTGEYDGVLLLDFRLSAFDENIKNITLGNQGFLYVTDVGGKEIIYAPYNPIIYRIDNEFVLSNDKEKTIIQIGEESFQIVFKRSDSWNIMGVFPLSDVRATVNNLQLVTIMLFICTTALVLVFSNRINSMLITPLGKLQKLMRSAENGNIDVRFPVESDDEIGALGNSFNQMLSEIQKLLEIIDLENRRKREAEFQVLQEQIKPHFLYNTLDTINWIAVECGATEIIRLVTALTNLFRISLNRGKELTTIMNEIEHVRSYLTIQSIRYEDMFSYSFDLGPDTPECNVLKLILQPLVENSIYHGIKERATGEESFTGEIIMTVKRESGMIVLCVKDNGLGIPPDKVRQLNEMFNSGIRSEEFGQSFGLYNVNQRLKYAFGEDYGLILNSTEGLGTEVVVNHPVLDKSDIDSVEGYHDNFIFYRKETQEGAGDE